MLELKKFHGENNAVIQQKYPEMFDPKWIVMESGWPYFHLSSLDNQPWKEMYKEAEELNFERAAEIRDEISKLEKSELNI